MIHSNAPSHMTNVTFFEYENLFTNLIFSYWKEAFFLSLMKFKDITLSVLYH